MTALRVLVIGMDRAFASAVRDLLTAQLPEAACELMEPSHVRTRPDAGAVVVDAREGDAPATDAAGRLRAMGFAGAVALIGAPSERLADAASRHGCGIVAADRLASELVPRLAELMAASDLPHTAQVMRARRLIAAGELALTLQHSLNNPIAGIMAEAQLMQMDAATPDQQAAFGRIVALCRRMIELTRTLDGVGERKTVSSGPAEAAGG